MKALTGHVIWLDRGSETTHVMSLGHGYPGRAHPSPELNLIFSFSSIGYQTMIKKSMMPYYLPIGGGRIVRFVLFPMVWVLYEMQTA